MDLTKKWAGDLGIDFIQSQNIGAADNGIDSQYDPTVLSNDNWSWHFNRSRTGDSRLTHRDEELAKAKRECTNPTDNPFNASAYLGRALHPDQDWVAHGDFNRIIEAPSLQLSWITYRQIRHYIHNYDALLRTGGLYGLWNVDNTEFDARGPDGRATIDTMEAGTLLDNGDQVYWTGFHGGHQRINLTERRTKDLLREFQAHVRAHARPCGKCWKAFLGGN